MAADPKGPKLDIPDDLAEALAASDGEEAGEEARGAKAPDGGASEGSSSGAAPAAAGGDAGVEEKLRADLAGLQDRLLRMAAEQENQRRRWLRDQQESLNFANENLIKDLLPTVDNLERALEHARQAKGDELEKKNLLEGIELTHRSLMGVLERSGVELIGAQGVPFDPRFHEAMRQIPSAEHPPNTIIDVYQRGYALKGRLLRPALVAISGPAPKSE